MMWKSNQNVAEKKDTEVKNFHTQADGAYEEKY